MSLTLALNSALSGLNINQRNLQVLSQNIANANTAGYSRQVLEQSAVYLDGVGAGVSVASITRKASELLQQTVREKQSDQSRSSTIESYLQQAQLFYGQPGSANSFDSTAQSFFNNLQSLSVSPESGSIQQAAISSGVTLARQISSMASGLENLRFTADQEIFGSISAINNELDSLYKVNAAITRAASLGQPTAGLLDQRDKSLKAVSEYMNISITYKDDGSIRIFGPGGIPLVDDQQHRLQYTPIPSLQTLVSGGTLSAFEMITLNSAGTQTGAAIPLIGGGAATPAFNYIISGKLAGLTQLRDVLLPASLAELDNFAAGLRDEMNALHNSGSGIPGLGQLTGTRLIATYDALNVSGQVRIAVLDKTGQPVPSPYGDESAQRPLTLDLGSLTSAPNTAPTVQTVIDAINTQLGTPQNKAELGNLNNIALVSQSSQVNTSSQSFAFDFNLDNISGTTASFWMTGLTVKDDSGATISTAPSASTIPKFDLSASGTYSTTLGSSSVTIKTVTAPNVHDGDVVYLGTPGAIINGINASDLTGFFEVSNVSATGFTIQAANGAQANNTSAVGAAGVSGYPQYDAIESGETRRTTANGGITVDLSGNPSSSYYDIITQVAVDDGSGVPTASSITYRVYNNTVSLYNKQFGASSVQGSATLVRPLTNTPALKAILVDANGVELPKNSSGAYADGTGYLKLATVNSDYTIAIDELNSQEAGTGRGFSHYFDLNDFFKSNNPTTTGDAVDGSAINMAVSDFLANNPGALAVGVLTRSIQPTDPTAPPIYTYQRLSGDNSIAQRMASLGLGTVDFAASGTLSAQNTSFTNYASLVLGSAATQSQNIANENSSNQSLLQGFQDQLNAVIGVNLDEELGNTIIYQNSYAATARIITVVNQMMEDLIGIFQ